MNPMNHCEHRLEERKMKSKVLCKSCYAKQYRIDNVEYIKEQKNQYYKDNVEYIKEQQKQYRKNNVEYIKEQQKQYRKNNVEYFKQNAKQYYKDNVEYIKEQKKQYKKDKRKSDPLFKMIANMRSRLYTYAKLKGSNKTWDLLGCRPIELRDWLEGQFQEGMSWDNQGEWHIDHILPLCAAKTTEDLKILAHYTNLQPLWAEDNFIKGGR